MMGATPCSLTIEISVTPNPFAFWAQNREVKKRKTKTKGAKFRLTH
jgi:hypothetical protein